MMEVVNKRRGLITVLPRRSLYLKIHGFAIPDLSSHIIVTRLVSMDAQKIC